MKCYFYNKSNLAACRAAGQSWSLFKRGTSTMACWLEEAVQEKNYLIAIDSLDSPVARTVHTGLHIPAFDAYGYDHIEDLPIVGFNGEPFDECGSLYWLGMGYRSYHPTLRRFNRPDEASPFAEGGLNTYAFVSGDPVNFTDPSGHARMMPAIKNQSKFLFKYKLFGDVVNDQDYGRAVLVGHRAETGVTVIKGHGNRDEGTVGGLTPKQLVQAMKETGNPLQGPVYLINCYGANRVERGGQRVPSVAKQLADEIGQPVIGYRGKVTSSFQYSDPTDAPDWMSLWLHDGEQKNKPKVFYPSAKRVGYVNRLMMQWRSK